MAKASTTTTTTTTNRDENRELELAGIGGVALLAIIGGAVAISRRKRDDEEEVVESSVVTTRTVEPVAAPVYEATSTAPVVVEPLSEAPAAAAFSAPLEGQPTTALPEGFDLSRYGPHVQAAYRGPTEDNPSLSLRHRLKRARFMDQRAREAGTIDQPIETAKPVTQNIIGAKLKERLGFRPVKMQTNFRPAFNAAG